MLRQLFLAFCIAAPVCAAANIYVAKPTPDSATQSWGQLQVKENASGQSLTIAGKTYKHSLGTHAASEIIYELGGEYTSSAAWASVDDEMRGYTNGTVVLRVSNDGEKVYYSGAMRSNDPARPVKVDVAGLDQLKLVATDGGDGNKDDQANWVEPVLTGNGTGAAKATEYSVKAPGLAIYLDQRGRISGSSVAALKGWTQLGDCREVGDVAVKQLAGGGYAFTRQLADPQHHSATLTERFTPTLNSIRWEIEITSDDKPWSTAIQTEFRYPATPESRFWTTWGHPDNDPKEWADPLAWQPFADRAWGYQYSDYTQMGSATKRALSIPMFSVAEPKTDAALTFMQSLDDTLLDLSLSETSTGDIRFQREKYRLGEGRTVRFRMDLAAHPADTRAGLGWVVARYPQFFNPGIARADELSGSGAYSGNENPIDVVALKKMGFAFNWKLSDDFPYMGQFIPPVKSADDKWTRSCAEPAPPEKGRETSCRQMNDYARYMKENGFAVLSYFNVTEYGKDMPWPIPPRKAEVDADLWKNAVDYLYYGGLRSAVIMDGSRPVNSNCYGAVIVDPGEPSYSDHIVEQVRRNNVMLPDVDGICIDRLDWLNLYNERGDDGVSWVNGKPARSLFVSFQRLADRIVPELHKSGKVLFFNNCTPRIEVIGRGDGIFGEWASNMFGLQVYVNYTALAAVRKPACLWTAPGEASDFYFQRCLYLGVYPIAPYPNNNHCLTPSAEGQAMVKNMYAAGKDDQFVPTPEAAASPEGLSLAYGPLLTAMRGKKWVLAAHCVETATPNVKVNLFEVPDGYVLPVSFGGKAESAIVQVRNIPGLGELKAVALHPGLDATAPVASSLKGDVLTLTVPLVRGCAMVKLSK